jgi:hypothetical protein
MTFWRNFETKAALEEAVRRTVNPVPYNVEFESSLISDLIAERHWYCKHNRLRPTRFKRTSAWNGGYDFYGWFDSIGWHKVSWRKCIRPDNVDNVLKRAIRTAIRPIIAEYKASHPVCERCGTCPSKEVDHVSPTFDEMYQEAVATMSDEDKERVMARQNWDDESEFRLPNDDPLIESILGSHRGAQLQAVCTGCHQDNARERRQQSGTHQQQTGR